MTSNEPQVDGEPRKKRAKIVSACGECRRRKTKCNGELPCRSCYKADVPCVYPVISHAEDKRNNISKAALEAIEDRLKGIENMLHAILRSQPFVTELPSTTTNQYPTSNNNDSNNSESSSPPSSITFPRTYIQPPPNSQPSSSSPSSSSSASSSSPFVVVRPSHHSSSPPSQQQQKLITVTSSPDVRLPSIHDLSAHTAYSSSSPPSASLVGIKQESTTESATALPHPLGYSTYYPHSNCRFEMVSPDPSNENRLTSISNKNKRKRS